MLIASFLVLFSLQLLAFAQAIPKASRDDNDTVQLHFLNILPFPNSQPNSGWDRAYELIPAAQLATDHINNASDILQGYKLNLVTTRSESCGIRFINEGLINPYVRIFDKKNSYNVLGMGGLFCSTVTNAVTSVFSSPKVTYLQLAGSTTPVHRDSSRFPWLVHFVSSSTIFNDAILALMKAFHWTKISIIYDTSGIFFKTDALDFLNRAKEAEVDIITALPLPAQQTYDNIFPILTTAKARVIYVTAPNSKCALVMCEAYKNKAMYPGYVYIFHDKSIADIVSRADSTDCTTEQLMDAIEGVLFIKYNLTAQQDTKLVSDMTFREYHQEYASRVMTLQSIRNESLDTTNAYANVMYDQIWAFALAVQGSLQKIRDRGINLGDIQLRQSHFIAETLRSEIRNVSFQGASGYISFNSDIEEKSLVRIFQVLNNTEELMGEYYGEFNESSCVFKDDSISLCLLRAFHPPPDTFETRILLLPPWVSSFINVIIAFCVLITTVLFIFLYILLKHRPEVKASSLSLSIIMYIGCYFVFIAALMRNVSRGYEIKSSAIFTAACNLEMWLGSIGMTLVFSALLMRLLRIYNIFKTYGRVSRYWKDRYLILCVLAICFGEITILFSWTIADRIRKFSTITYKASSTPPYFELHSTCNCNSLGPWLSAVFSYNGVLMGLVVLMAVQTRKIKRSNFKDTKKTNAFIAITCMSVIILLSLWYVMDVALQDYVSGHVIACFAFLCIGIYCQLFIFLPLAVVILTKTKRKIEKKASVTSFNIPDNQALVMKQFTNQGTLFVQLFHAAFIRKISISSINTDFTSD